VLPIQDVIPSRSTPYATLTLVAVSAIATTYQAALDQPARLGLALDYGLLPASMVVSDLFTSLIFQPDFIAGVVNLLVLWIFAENIEDRLGWMRFLSIYFGGGALAGLAAVGLDPTARVILPAASGAVAAVVGAYLVLFPRSRVMVLVPLFKEIDIVDVPAMVIALGWVGIHCVRYAGTFATPEPMVGAVATPLAGLAIGGLAALTLGQRNRMSSDWWD
jgi:membrane associated rhomboid family serine protease